MFEASTVLPLPPLGDITVTTDLRLGRGASSTARRRRGNGATAIVKALLGERRLDHVAYPGPHRGAEHAWIDVGCDENDPEILVLLAEDGRALHRRLRCERGPENYHRYGAILDPALHVGEKAHRRYLAIEGPFGLVEKLLIVVDDDHPDVLADHRPFPRRVARIMSRQSKYSPEDSRVFTEERVDHNASGVCVPGTHPWPE